MSHQDAIEALLAKQEIHEALARYCRGIDRGDAELVRSAYHEDATDDHGFTVVETGWDIAALADRDNPNGFPVEWESSTHFLGQSIIELDGDRAASETYFHAVMRFEHDGVAYELVNDGRYIDRWERRDGGTFLISDRTVMTDGMRTDRIDGAWPGPDTDVPKAFWGAPALPPSDPKFGTRTAEDHSYSVLPRLSGVGAS
jgi:hypothetical protein